MRKLVTIIRPHRLQAVQRALFAVGAQGVTISEVLGFGGSNRQESDAGFGPACPGLRLEVVVPNHAVLATVDSIIRAARTGEAGDGKIFITALDDVVRIRTGETGEEAL